MYIPRISATTGCVLGLFVVAGQVWAANPQSIAPATAMSLPPVVAATQKIHSVQFSGNTAFSEAQLTSLVAPELGRDMTLQDMKNLALKVQNQYHAAGFRLAKVVVPQQNFATGTLNLVVLEGRLGKVESRGVTRTNPEIFPLFFAAEQVTVGKPIDLANAEKAMVRLSRLSGIEATSTLKPGVEQGTTDLLINVTEAPRIKGSLELNNYGGKNTGEIRAIASAEAQNVTGVGDALSFIGLMGVDQSGVYFVRLGYARPVNSKGGKISYYVGVGNTEVGGQFSALDIQGDNTSAGFGYIHDFVKSARVIHTLETWVEVQNLEQSFLGVKTFDDRIRKVRVTYQIDESTAKGRNLAAISLHQGLGAKFGGMPNGSPMSSKAIAGADNNFTKLTFDVARVHMLSPRTRLIAQWSGQYALDPLVSSEQWGIGGYGSVVGQTPSAFSGDSGVTLGLEARRQLFETSQQWQLIGRVDHGRISIKKPFLGQKATESLSGILMGLAYTPNPKMEFRVDLAKPVGEKTDAGSYLYAQARYRF